MSLKIEQIKPEDQRKVLDIVKHFWGDPMIVIHGDVFHTPELSGLKAVINHNIVGISHFYISDQVCEIITIASLQQNKGIGSSLLDAVESLAASQKCRKLSVTTTNDNLNALGFYQRRGFILIRLHPGQIAKSRQIKPSIPLVGENDIPLRDELVLEKRIETNHSID